MPELGIKESTFTTRLKPLFNQERYPSNEAIQQLATQEGEEYIGAGREVVVIGSKTKPDRVVAINYEDLTPEKAKEIFYLQRIFSTPFPHNFPHFYAAFGKPDTQASVERDYPTGTIRHRVIAEDNTAEETAATNPNHAFPFTKVFEVCSQLKIPVYIERSKDNFLVSEEDDGVYYVDKLKILLPDEKLPWDVDRIMQYMRSTTNDQDDNQYSETDRNIVLKSINRLAELGIATLQQ